MSFKKWIKNEPQDIFGGSTANVDEYYVKKPEEVINENDGKNKMILLEPRAYSETQQIADQLKARNTVVVNLKRVTPDQAERIIDFVSGTLYAIDGAIQKIGPGIFLCTPNNVNVQGSITDENSGKDIHNNDDITLGW